VKTKINELTPEQAAILPRFRDEWLHWGICTERADRPRAEAAILAMRERIGVCDKPVFVWCDSPATSLMALRFLKSPELGASLQDSLQNSLGNSLGDLWDSLQASLGGSLHASLHDNLGVSLHASLGVSLRDSLQVSLWDSLGASFRNNLQVSLGASLYDSLQASLQVSLGTSTASLMASLRDSFDNPRDGFGQEWWGQHDSYWIAFYLFCRDVFGIKYNAQNSFDLDLWRDVAQSCCWWWCYQNYVIVSERPTIVRLDDREVLHSEDGPALQFLDGWAVHSWHGVRVPAQWIENRGSLTPAAALGQRNVEQRRAACEILGWATILDGLKAKLIDRDGDPTIGELLEVNLPDSGRERFLRVLCGTGRTFAIPVPPTVQTALEANAWTYDIPASLMEQKENRT
jgi:hypothetical protein